MKEFLEDYDDDRDDSKYYKGSKLEQRLAERNRELQKDVEDRQREKEEIEELRAQIVREGYKDPNAELERRLAMQERFNNPALFFQPQPVQPPPQQKHYEEVILDDGPHDEAQNGQFSREEADLSRFERSAPVVMIDSDHHSLGGGIGDHDDDDDGGHYDAAPSPTYSHNSNSNSGFRFDFLMLFNFFLNLPKWQLG